MDEFDVGDGGVCLIGDLLFKLLDVCGDSEVDVKGKRLLFGGGFEEEFYHLKKYQIIVLDMYYALN
jgi:hypothetical protein